MEAANPFTAPCRKALQQEITADLLHAHRPTFIDFWKKDQWLRVSGLARLATEKGQRCPPLIRIERNPHRDMAVILTIPQAMHKLIPQ